MNRRTSRMILVIAAILAVVALALSSVQPALAPGRGGPDAGRNDEAEEQEEHVEKKLAALEPYDDYGELAITSTGKTIAIWGEGFSWAGPGAAWFNRQR